MGKKFSTDMIIKPFVENNCINKSKVLIVCEICKQKEKVFYKSEIDLILQCLKNKKKYPTGQYHCWPCSQKTRKTWGKSIGSLYKLNQGYLRVKTKEGRKHVHRTIVESFLGRKLSPTENVHHIDFDQTNNVIDNLYVCNNSEHRKLSRELERLGYNFLNKKLWFDKKKKIYTLQHTEKFVLPEPIIVFPEYSNKIYAGRHDRTGKHYPTVQIARHIHKSYWKLVMEYFVNGHYVLSNPNII